MGVWILIGSYFEENIWGEKTPKTDILGVFSRKELALSNMPGKNEDSAYDSIEIEFHELI